MPNIDPATATNAERSAKLLANLKHGLLVTNDGSVVEPGQTPFPPNRTESSPFWHPSLRR
jgi:hypothetical protein